MDKYIEHDEFWHSKDIPGSLVFERFPTLHHDNRGTFLEVLIGNTIWMKQANRSISIPGVARGMHAQVGKHCQGKFVQCVQGMVQDIILDSRPDSETFGICRPILLDAKEQNQLWVPRGFLHGFYVPVEGNDQPAIFEYFCDNPYDPESEVCICPVEIMDKYCDSKPMLSGKDLKGIALSDWLGKVKRDYKDKGVLWYR